MSIKLHCGDCLNVMGGISTNFIDLTVTSPPYDNLRDYGGEGRSWNFDTFTPIAKELYRITKPGGVLVWIVNDGTVNGGETGTSFRQALFFQECGFTIHDTMIWKKISCFQNHNRYIPSFEYMFVLSKGKPKTVNLIKDRENKSWGKKVHGLYVSKDGTKHRHTAHGKNKGIKKFGSRLNIWEVPPNRHNHSGHPAVFPGQLARDHIITWSNPGDIVFDPFMGSGTTGREAILLGRDFIGVEINPTYFKISKKTIFPKLEVTVG